MRIDIAYKTLAELRAFTAQDVRVNKKIFMTDEGKEGEWIYDSSDTTSADNIGTIVVTTSGGFRFKRKYKANVYASWFIDTADTSGTSGNRERNAINRAVVFALAQTVSPTIVLDNNRIWYVNNNPIIIKPEPSQILKIIGEGNPIIDFYHTTFPESVECVFSSDGDDYAFVENQYDNGTFILEGVQFDGDRNPEDTYLGESYGVRPIYFTNMERVEIRNCVFRNIYGSGMAIGVTKSGIIESNEFYSVSARQENPPDATGDGISIYAFCKDMQILNNYCEILPTEFGRCGISVDSESARILVSGNKIIGYERGLHIENCRDNVISNNHVFRSPASTSTFNKNCIWEGNVFDGKDLIQESDLSGTGLFWTSDEEGCTYRNNIFKRWEGDGGENIYLARFWGDGLTITNNQFGEEKNVNNSRTSTSSNALGTGSKTFTFSANANLCWKVGQLIRAYSTTDGYYMEGAITSVSGSGGTVTINFADNFGTGTKTSWMLHYASQGRVYATSFGKSNVFKENTFVKANLEIGATESAIVNYNIFKGCNLLASGVDVEVGDDQPTYNIQIVGNEFVPYTDEVHSKGILANLTVNAFISDNVFRNPIANVVGNTASTGMICTNNTYIRSYDSAAGNSFWYTASVTETNVTRGMKPNIIHDYINTKTWYVWNNGDAEEAFRLKLTGGDITLVDGGSSTKYLSEDGTYTTPSGGSGDVSVSGTPTSGQIAEWTNATTIQGVAVTGTGNIVRATSATLVTPNLGTPSAVVLTNATGIPAAQLSGTIPTGVLGASTHFIGTTSIALNRSSATQTLTGITSIDGYAAAVTLTADNSTDATNYPLFTNAATGNLSPRTDTGYTYNPSTGTLSTTVVSVGNTGFTVGASTPFSDNTGILTLQNIDALDATTEATIEAAIDTLANLTSIQGQTVTLTGAFIRSGAHSLTLTTTGTTTVTLPTTGTLATTDGTETFLNKTLTAAKIANAGRIDDPNGNEYITFVQIGSAVNQWTVTNAATGGTPSWSVTGGDTNINANIVSKGTGVVQANGVQVVTTTGILTLTNKTLTDAVNTVSAPTTLSVGYLGIPQNSQSTAYTLVMADSGKHILHPSADTTARTFTIPANSSVAFPIGTSITFVNQNAAGVVTIAITTDTMRLAGAGTTGSRTLAANGVATAIKITSTEWIISGNGLT